MKQVKLLAVGCLVAHDASPAPFAASVRYIENTAGGKIRDVEALGMRMPYGSKPGWD